MLGMSKQGIKDFQFTGHMSRGLNMKPARWTPLPCSLRTSTESNAHGLGRSLHPLTVWRDDLTGSLITVFWLSSPWSPWPETEQS